METTIIKKKNSGGRRKIEIKKLENKKNLQVTFSKRRTGLFKKAAKFSELSGADIALIVQSPGGKIFASGGPSPINSILDRYLAAASSSSSSADNAVDHHEKICAEDMEKIEEDKVKEEGEEFLWDQQPLDNLDWADDNLDWIDELKEYMVPVEDMENNAEEMGKADNIANVDASSSLLIPQCSSSSFWWASSSSL